MTEEEKKQRAIAWAEIRHFSWEEFSSPDDATSGLLMNLEFVRLLDKGRAATGFPWHINSGYRTSAHNLKVGGKAPSEHLSGNGVDVAVGNGAERMAIVKWALTAGIKRIGIAKGFVHLGMSFDLPQDVIWVY
jgi:hypothetical protein